MQTSISAFKTEDMSIYEAAKKYNVPRITLSG